VTSIVYGVFGGQQSAIGVFGGVLAIGFLIGTFGHIIRSKTLIITGIIVIGMTTAYFAFVVAKIR
jgi:hypothetical protein